MCVPWVAKLRGFSIDQGSNPIEVVEPMKTCVVKPMYAAFSPKYLSQEQEYHSSM